MVRRTEDEVISEDFDLSTNRGNHLLMYILKARFPNIIKTEQIAHVNKMLSNVIEKSQNTTGSDDLCYSLIMSYVSEHSRQYPLDIGADYTVEQRNQMAEYLVRKHFVDFKSSHCTPLPADYFTTPWDIPNEENDFVFT